jgi:DHA3 family macrolide efflux protein-like MFS transporter
MVAADLISAACMVVLITLFMTGNVQLWHIYTDDVHPERHAGVPAASGCSQHGNAGAGVFPDARRRAEPDVWRRDHGGSRAAGCPGHQRHAHWAGFGDRCSDGGAGRGAATVLHHPANARVPVAGRPSLWGEFREGVATVWQDIGLRQIYALLAVVVLVIMPSFMLSPLLVKEYFGGGAPQVALLESLGGGGMVAGGILVTVFSPRRKVTWLLWGFALACLAIALTALAPPTMFWLATFWWLVSGIAFVAGSAPLTAAIAVTRAEPAPGPGALTAVDDYGPGSPGRPGDCHTAG